MDERSPAWRACRRGVEGVRAGPAEGGERLLGSLDRASVLVEVDTPPAATPTPAAVAAGAAEPEEAEAAGSLVLSRMRESRLSLPGVRPSSSPDGARAALAFALKAGVDGSALVLALPGPTGVVRPTRSRAFLPIVGVFGVGVEADGGRLCALDEVSGRALARPAEGAGASASGEPDSACALTCCARLWCSFVRPGAGPGAAAEAEAEAEGGGERRGVDTSPSYIGRAAVAAGVGVDVDRVGIGAELEPPGEEATPGMGTATAADMLGWVFCLVWGGWVGGADHYSMGLKSMRCS